VSLQYEEHTGIVTSLTLPFTLFISERELTFTFAICCRPSVRPSVCCL